jgi:hypothetical protein
MESTHKAILLAAVSAFLAGCSGGSTGLTTGSLFGSKQADAVAAAPVETPSLRAAQVAAVSARAAKCGYNFDAARLKSGFLASEATNGASAQDMGKIEREYDTIRAKVATSITSDPDFCSDGKTREIKADLTRHIAGDYSAPLMQKRVIDEKLLASGPRARETLNPEFLTDKYASKTKRIEE